MFIDSHKKFYLKSIAVFTVLNLVLQLTVPNLTFGLTGGPSQPEVTSFEPVGTTQMVDLATGDFTYNIPLLTVPGPNGGYPINLAYHGGIGMEQEASWVGLGWNINVGAINRNMRGLPDDFKGDTVARELSMKNNVTVGFTKNLSKTYSKEFWGFDLEKQEVALNAALQVYYNNYRGIGFKTGLSLRNQSTSTSDKAENSIIGKLDLSFDSQSGMAITPSIGYGKSTEDNVQGWFVSPAFHSRQGMAGLSLKYDLKETFNRRAGTTRRIANRNNTRMLNALSRGGAGTSFSGATYVPGISTSMTGWNTGFQIVPGKVNTAGNFLKSDFRVDGNVSMNRVKSDSSYWKAYGTMYHENVVDSIGIMDYNKEKDIAVTRRTPAIPMPVRTHDVFSVAGQGVGGVFRAYRSDVGIVKNQIVRSKSHDISAGVELGTSTTATPNYHIGVNASYGYNSSYSGPWKRFRDNLDSLEHQGIDLSDGNRDINYEPFYFKANGEQLASPVGVMDTVGGELPVAFELSNKWHAVSAQPRAHKVMNPGGTHKSITTPIKSYREARSQGIEYRTRNEVVNDFHYEDRGYHIFSEGYFPHVDIDPDDFDTDNKAQQINYNSASTKGHHLVETSVVNPDGTRYIYALPAYNKVHKDVSFAVDVSTQSVDNYETRRRVKYTDTEASTDNNSGQDNFYSSSSTPPYAHSYLLTEIHSTDYVDMTGDGPSDDDLGYFTKFNYTKLGNDFKWRVPFTDANYSKGYYHNEQDDRASYSYGEKETYYLNSVETKTHIAVFELGTRADGLGVQDEANHSTNPDTLGENLRYLKTITLYSKEDLTNPIQKVHFDYTYELCEGVPNNDGSTDALITSNEGGKLTLKQVWFTHLNNNKGSLTPYEFTYANNPDYSLNTMDRWGNYKPDDDYLASSQYWVNQENPYTRQDDNYTHRDTHASAWNMTKISLPSGGEINIEYEADDYSHVQDKRAMQMCRIVGTQKLSGSILQENDLMLSNDTLIDNTHTYNKLFKNHRRIYFEMESAVTTNAEVDEYLEDVDEIYFKVFMDLKYPGGLDNAGDGIAKAEDYVTGYAKVKKDGNGKPIVGKSDDASTRIGYFEVEEVGYRKNESSSLLNAHPFRKAGWQYLRYQRPDLFYNPDNSLLSNFGNIISLPFTIINEAMALKGYYKHAAFAGYCKKVTFGQKPSYVRLNSPDYIKYGGGCRVKKLTISDNWTEGSQTTGQTFEYRTADGQSSGVADYEPLIGGEENPFRKPVWYNGNDQLISFQHKDAYLEEPFGESLYPGANVTYGRVVVKNLEDASYTKAQTGITVSEFYTSKDFPVTVKRTGLKHVGYNVPIIIPFIGSQSFMNNGYSQGYSIILNDMSGKPKRVATYPYDANFDAISQQPVSEVQYVYHTDPNDAKMLFNEVPVMDDDGSTRIALLGQTYDFYTAEEENSSWGINGGVQINLDGVAPFGFPIGLPSIEYHESMYRALATNKIIYKTGILKEVRNFSDGAKIITKNLMYDATSGSVLLSAVNNEFDESVYTYNYAAHWAYDGMGPAYKNYRTTFKLSDHSTVQDAFEVDAPTISNYADVFVEGDEIVVDSSGTYRKYFVTDVGSNYFKMQGEGENVPTYTSRAAFIARSGRRNLQGVTNGTTVALGDENIKNLINPIMIQPLTLMNGISDGTIDYTDVGDGHSIYDIKLCGIVTGGNTYYEADSVHVEKITVVSNDKIRITTYGTGINGYTYDIDYDDNAFPAGQDTVPNMEVVGFNPDNTLAEILLKNKTTGSITSADWQDYGEAPWSCYTFRVLHASATEFADTGWAYNYADVGDPDIVVNGTAKKINGNTTIDEHRYGQRGIWRGKRAWVYQVDRDQQGSSSNFKTRAPEDGEYNDFIKFDWDLGSSGNNLWTWTNEMTKYSPYGFQLENKNALDLYSTEMFGYGNSVVTAMASNGQYQELAFDGLEEHATGTTTYDSIGHWQFDNSNGVTIIDSVAHTGSQSLYVHYQDEPVHSVDLDDGEELYFEPELGKKYIFSAWVRTKGGAPAQEGTVTIKLDGVTLNNSSTTSGRFEEIDGWTKLDVPFTMPTTITGNGIFEIELGVQTATHYDDIRVGPFNGGVVSYVYDPVTLWLLAELDGLNYATFYAYDEEGNLTIVKKETDRGVVTVSSSRQHVAQ